MKLKNYCFGGHFSKRALVTKEMECLSYCNTMNYDHCHRISVHELDYGEILIQHIVIYLGVGGVWDLIQLFLDFSGYSRG